MSEQTISVEELEKFTTRHRREILFYLHQLINDGERVSVVFDNGNEALLTVLLDIREDEDLLVFDWGGSQLANRKLLSSERNVFICAPHGVKNQFVTGPVRETAYKKRPAFATRLPDHYTRLQRREFFRLALPMTRRPACFLTRENGSILQLAVVDISIGGVAVEIPGGRLDFEIGQVLKGARIELKGGGGGVGTLDIDLEVRNSGEIQRGGKVCGRIGCQFVKLSHAMENQLQRFITDVQREERARLGA